MSKVQWFGNAMGVLVALLCVLQFVTATQGDDLPNQVAPLQVGGEPLQPQFKDVPASHRKVADVPVRSTDGKYQLQTIGIDAAGRVLALTAPPRPFGPPVSKATSEIHIFSPEGKPLEVLKVAFHANAVAGGPDGNIYVAGDGKAVKFSKEGKQLAVFDLPYIQEALKDEDGARKLAIERLKMERESIEEIVATYKQQVANLEKKKETDRTNLEKRQLAQFRQILESMSPQLRNDDAAVDEMVNQITGRLRTVNALAFSNKEIYVVCGDTKGFGYAVWRMDHDFQNHKQVLSGLMGCCGQMDVQTSGDDLLVAENTKHRFARYDRDGKALGAWGKNGGPVTALDCFGGCCNPMNLCATAKGDVFTAESEGFIKRFSAKGDFLGLVASVPLTGNGCKNVAFTASADEQRIYLLDLNGSHFVVLERNTTNK